MTTFIPSPEFTAFCETHTIEGVKPVTGGCEVRYYTPFVYTPEQQAFDVWERGQRKNLFTWDIPKQNSGQPPVNW